MKAMTNLNIELGLHVGPNNTLHLHQNLIVKVEAEKWSQVPKLTP